MKRELLTWAFWIIGNAILFTVLVLVVAVGGEDVKNIAGACGGIYLAILALFLVLWTGHLAVRLSKGDTIYEAWDDLRESPWWTERPRGVPKVVHYISCIVATCLAWYAFWHFF